MKKLLLLVFCLCLMVKSGAQEKTSLMKKESVKKDLPDMRKCIRNMQENVLLFTQNFSDHSKEVDANSIILDIERTIDSMTKNKTYADLLLIKNFAPLRHFFLTTSNKTSVAAFFLYRDAPYQFCYYNDTALVLYIGAIKDGDTYNLSKMTEKRIAKRTFENCLLPSLKALDEFKDNEIKYIAVSVYYGCKDTREGAPAVAVAPYCLTLVARMSDLSQYAAGMITAKGLFVNAELYLSDEESYSELRRVQADTE